MQVSVLLFLRCKRERLAASEGFVFAMTSVADEAPTMRLVDSGTASCWYYSSRRSKGVATSALPKECLV